MPGTAAAGRLVQLIPPWQWPKDRAVLTERRWQQRCAERLYTASLCGIWAGRAARAALSAAYNRARWPQSRGFDPHPRLTGRPSPPQRTAISPQQSRSYIIRCPSMAARVRSPWVSSTSPSRRLALRSPAMIHAEEDPSPQSHRGWDWSARSAAAVSASAQLVKIRGRLCRAIDPGWTPIARGCAAVRRGYLQLVSRSSKVAVLNIT